MRKRGPLPEAAAARIDASQPPPRQASAEYTAEFARRFAPQLVPDFYRQAHDGITISSIGIGTYLGECSEVDDERYADTIARAIAAGVNLVDTAINYRCQRSERAVGTAI
jgi:Aldo/keto reductase family